MSTDYTAYALIGVRFVQPDPPERTEPSCRHPERVGQAFCPVCGTRVGERRVTDWMANADVLEGIENSLPDGWVLARSGEHENGEFLGFGCSRGWRAEPSWNTRQRIPPMEDVLRVCQAVLEPHGLWSDAVGATFGLHCVMRAG